MSLTLTLKCSTEGASETEDVADVASSSFRSLLSLLAAAGGGSIVILVSTGLIPTTRKNESYNNLTHAMYDSILTAVSSI